MADLGKVAVRARGEWVIGVAYETLDMVTHNLNLYIALKDTAIEPTDDGVNWQLLIEGVPIATASEAGKSKPDGKTITIDPDGTLHGASQVPEGVTYVDLQSSDSEQLPKRLLIDADTLGGNLPEYFVSKQEIRNLEVDSVTIWTVQVSPIPSGNILCKKVWISEDGWGTRGMYTDMGGFFLWQSGTTKEDTKAEFGYLDVANQYQSCFNFKSDGSAEFGGELYANNGLTAKGASLFNGTVTHTGFTHLRNTAISYNHGFYFGNPENKDSYLFFTGTDKKLYLNYYATDGSGYTIITFSNNYPSFNAGLTVEPTAAPNFTGKCGIQFTNIYHGDNVHKIVQNTNTNNLVFCNSKTPFSGFVESAHVDINGNWVFKKNIAAPNIASTTAELLTAQQDITEADLQNIELQQRVAQLEEKVQVLTGGDSLGRTDY